MIEESDSVITHLSKAKPMLSSPVCLDEVSSSVTLVLVYTYVILLDWPIIFEYLRFSCKKTG
jgi:hypothetical protein